MDINLSIIIVNYNSKNVLLDCLNSLQAIRVNNYEVLIIDNASDESIKDLESIYPDYCFFYNIKNLGYAAANNIGIKHAKGKYLLLLNPDTIVFPDSFGAMLNYLEEHPDVGITGCKIFNKNGDIERSTHSFPNLLK
jgi:GT2 family glycosyltransferase